MFIERRTNLHFSPAFCRNAQGCVYFVALGRRGSIRNGPPQACLSQRFSRYLAMKLL
jgi:hypothetical protein